MDIFRYENQGTNTFLVYELTDADRIDELSLGMLSNNRIPGLAQTVFTQLDERRFIKFNVSSKIPISQFFYGKVSRKGLLGVFEGISQALASAEDYMLESRDILLDHDYIFADVSSGKTELICLPVTVEDKPDVNLKEFLRDIMFTTQFDPTENCDYVAKIINYLNSASVIIPETFNRFITELKAESKAVPKTDIAADSRYMRPAPAVNNYLKSAPDTAVQPTPGMNGAAAKPVPNINVKPTPAAELQPERQVSAPADKFGGMAVPNMPEKKVQSVPEDTGDEISLMYLLQHYNKDNAAAYKAQKERKKQAGEAKKSGNAGTGAPLPAPEPKENAKKKKNKKGSKNATLDTNPGFAVPGQKVPSAPPAQPDPCGGNNMAGVNPAAVPDRTLPEQITPTVVYTPPVYSPDWDTSAFAETTVLVENESGTSGSLAHLIRVSTREKILIDKPVFRIGIEKSYVDYYVSGNGAVSRSHANIISRDGRYFVVDTNSTNHTYINGQMISSLNETELHHGDKLRLANEDFVFNLY